MKLNDLHAKLFKNYKNLDINFNNLKPINFIIGNNGVGKSTILDTICYAFFGETLLGTKGDEVINKRYGKGMVVTLSFMVDDTLFEIKRYRKHKEYKNKVFLYKDGDDITKPSIKDTNELIVNVVGFNLETFRNVISFNSSSSETFVNATDKGKKEFLENLLNIDIFNKALDKTKELYKEDKAKLEQDKMELKSLEDKNDMAKQMVENYEIAMENWDVSEKKIKKSLMAEDYKLKDMEKTSNEVVEELEQKLEEIKNESISFFDDDKYNKIVNKVATLKAQKDSILREYNQVQQDFIKNKKDYDTIRKSKDARCIYCGNILDKEHKQKELSRLFNLLQEESSKGKELKANGIKVVQESKKLEATLNTLEEEKQEFIKKRNEHTTKLVEINNKLNEEKSKSNNYNNQVTIVNSLKEQLVTIDKQKPIKPDVDTFDEKIDKLTNKLVNETKHIDNLEVVKDLFNGKGLKNAYISSSLPIINEKINTYLSVLSDGEIACSILSKTQDKKGNSKDKIFISIDYPTRGDNIEFDNLSSGEKRIVTLSILLAFNYYFQRNNNIKLLLTDEVFDTLSSNRIENVLKLLDTIKDDYDYIFVISHLDDLKDNQYNKIVIKHDVEYNSILEV